MQISRIRELTLATENPHEGQPVLAAGAALNEAQAVMIMLHGRGASAVDILDLAAELEQPGLAFLAPQAQGLVWYPNRFLAPVASNQPRLDQALARVNGLVEYALQAGVAPERVFLLGFSQGASLALETAARSGRRWGGVFGLSGAVIGPPGSPRSYPAGLDGTPILLGCSDVDTFIPLDSVYESANILTELGAAVDTRIYPGMGHTIHPDEIDAVRSVLAGALKSVSR
jgi:predicted esterase